MRILHWGQRKLTSYFLFDRYHVPYSGPAIIDSHDPCLRNLESKLKARFKKFAIVEVSETQGLYTLVVRLEK